MSSSIENHHSMVEYNHIDRRIHFICQIISKYNRSYIPKEKDDSHTNLYFDNVGNRVLGRWAQLGDEKYLMALNLESQKIEILNAGMNTIHSISTINKTASAVELELEPLLAGLGFAISGFRDELHFEIQKYDFVNSPFEAFDKNSLKIWIEYRRLANEACLALLGYSGIWGEIRIWPHHFDTGIYIQINTDLSIGFGLAMEDSMVGAPYFYISGHSKSDNLDYQNNVNGKNWHWITGDWKGAVLPLDKLSEMDNSERLPIIENYIAETINWYLNSK